MPGVGGQGLERPTAHEADVVGKPREPAQRVDRRLDHDTRGGGLAHVARDRVRGATGGAHRFAGRLGACRVDVIDGDVGACRGDMMRDRRPDTGPCTGHEDPTRGEGRNGGGCHAGCSL